MLYVCECFTLKPASDCPQVQTQTLLLDGDLVRNSLQRFPPRLTAAARTQLFQTCCPAPSSAAMVTAPVSPRGPAWAVCVGTVSEENSAKTGGHGGVTPPRSWCSSSPWSCCWLLLFSSLKGAENKRTAVCSQPAAKM